MRMSPSDMIYLMLQRLVERRASSHCECEPLVGVFRMTPNRGRHSSELLLLDGNAALTDTDLDSGRLLSLLIELIAEDRGGDGEHADDEVENVAIHGLVAPAAGEVIEAGNVSFTCFDRERASLPGAIGHALIYDLALKRLDLLPHEPAAVFGQTFAIGLGSRNVGIRIVIPGADRDGAQGAERYEGSPGAAMTYAVSAAPH